MMTDKEKRKQVKRAYDLISNTLIRKNIPEGIAAQALVNLLIILTIGPLPNDAPLADGELDKAMRDAASLCASFFAEHAKVGLH
jgi:hypothetical protein